MNNKFITQEINKYWSVLNKYGNHEVPFNQGTRIDLFQKVNDTIDISGITMIKNLNVDNCVKYFEIAPIMDMIKDIIKTVNHNTNQQAKEILLDFSSIIEQYFNMRLQVLFSPIIEENHDLTIILYAISVIKSLTVIKMIQSPTYSKEILEWKASRSPKLDREYNSTFRPPITKQEAITINDSYFNDISHCHDITLFANLTLSYIKRHGMIGRLDQILNIISDWKTHPIRLIQDKSFKSPILSIYRCLSLNSTILKTTQLQISHSASCTKQNNSTLPDEIDFSHRLTRINFSSLNIDDTPPENEIDKDNLLAYENTSTIFHRLNQWTKPLNNHEIPNSLICPSNPTQTHYENNFECKCKLLASTNTTTRNELVDNFLQKENSTLDSFFFDTHYMIEQTIHEYRPILPDESITNLVNIQDELDSYYRVYDQGITSSTMYYDEEAHIT
jgi:hypothetical protein